MKSRSFVVLTAVAFGLSMAAHSLEAQVAPDTIFYNGKIVTMNNREVNGNVGTIAEAIAIQDGRLIAVGNNAEIRRLATGGTRSLDLGGRMVAPGFGATHDHPQDWNLLNPTIVNKVITDDMHIERFLNVPAEEVLAKFPRLLDEAVNTAKPGQWIRICLLYGKEYRFGPDIMALFGRQINKQILDLVAPNNPVIVRAGFVGTLINQKGLDEVRKFYGDQWGKFVFTPLDDLPGMGVTQQSMEKNGLCGVCYRQVEQDVIFKPAELKEIYRLGLSWNAPLGVTLSQSSFYTAGAIRAYDGLNRSGELPVRISWGWYWPYRNDFFQDPYFMQATVSREGTGSDYLWFSGMTPHMGIECTDLPATSPEVKKRERGCSFDDPVISRALHEYIKAGGRLIGDHQLADKEVDTVLDIIEKASNDAGMKPEEIASKRHVTEHMAMYPRPDQIPRFKKLGMMASGWDFFIWEGGGRRILRDYGERGANMVIPRKSLYDAGIMNTVEIDRPLSEYTNLTYFNVLYSGITRKDQDGNITAPQQGITREQMLKSATLFAAYSAKKENVLGSLERGKWADLVVLDRDYLTVPVDDIPKIHVLMTMVGGKLVHLAPSLAREWGIQPVGAQVELGGPAAQW